VCVCSDDGSATPVQDEQEDARPGSRQSDVSLDPMFVFGSSCVHITDVNPFVPKFF